MNKTKLIEIFSQFDEIQLDFNAVLLTSGHINQTYQVENGGRFFIVQKLNIEIFKNQEIIAENIQNLVNYLSNKEYPHPIVAPLSFKNGQTLWEGQWRIFDFIGQSQSFEKVESSAQAYEAARFLGHFHSYLLDFPIENISSSLPDFLNFNERMNHFDGALAEPSTGRLSKAKTAIDFVEAHRFLLKTWNEIEPDLPIRIIHADPKISNFLFDANNPLKILCLIDWDTLMPGSLLYDFGDMVRSYTNLRAEDDAQVGDNFSLENYKALKEGFLFHLESQLHPLEVQNLDLAAQLVIFIQAVRFLSDYLMNDVYYHTQYPEQNLDRTWNQIHLLKALREWI